MSKSDEVWKKKLDKTIAFTTAEIARLDKELSLVNFRKPENKLDIAQGKTKRLAEREIQKLIDTYSPEGSLGGILKSHLGDKANAVELKKFNTAKRRAQGFERTFSRRMTIRLDEIFHPEDEDGEESFSDSSDDEAPKSFKATRLTAGKLSRAKTLTVSKKKSMMKIKIAKKKAMMKIKIAKKKAMMKIKISKKKAPAKKIKATRVTAGKLSRAKKLTAPAKLTRTICKPKGKTLTIKIVNCK